MIRWDSDGSVHIQVSRESTSPFKEPADSEQCEGPYNPQAEGVRGNNDY